MQMVKRKPKRILSLLLTLCMILSLLPALSAPLLAATGSVTITGLTEAQIETALQDEIDVVAGSGGTVTVTGSKIGVTVGIDLSIPLGVTVVWKATYKGALDNGDYSDNYLISFDDGGTFEVATGADLLANISDVDGGMAIEVSGSGDVVVSDGLVVVIGDGATAIENNNGNVTITGGAVSAAGEFSTAVIGNYGTIKVSGGNVSASGDDSKVLYAETNAIIAVTGGTVTANVDGSSSDCSAIYVLNSGAAAYLYKKCEGDFGLHSSATGWIAKVAETWTGKNDSELTFEVKSSAYTSANLEWLNAPDGLYITDDAGDYTVLWDETAYSSADIAVIASMIDNNGLNWPKAPSNVDEIWLNDNWPGITWAGDYLNDFRITELNFWGASITNLTGNLNLSGLDKLEKLNVNGNNLTGLNLSGLTALEYLNCGNNVLTSLDVSGCSALKELLCDYNNLTSLNLSGLNDLIKVECTWNRFTAVGNVTITTPAFSAWGTGNFIFSPQKVVGLYNSGDIAVINAMIDNNGLAWDKGPADGSYCPTSWTGNVFWNSESTNRRIIGLDLSLKGLSGTLNVYGLAALVELDVEGNALTGLNVSGLAELKELNVNGNNLTGLNVSGLAKLETLYCENNSLTSLGFNSLTAVEYLYCKNNDLSSLNLSSLATLVTIDCSNNKLTSLGLGSPANLVELYCNNNMLDALDVSNCAILTKLDCAQNRLTGFDVTGLDDLVLLNCIYNYIDDDEFTTPGTYVTGVEVLAYFSGWGSGGFTFSPQHAPGFIAALKVVDLPVSVDAGDTLTLTGTVFPADATNNIITAWSITADGGTGSTLSGDVLNAGSPGSLELTAVVANGLAAGINLVWTFNIEVVVPDVLVTGITVTGAGGETTISADNGTLQMFAAVTPADATDPSVTWSVTNGTGSAAINPTGLLFAITNGTVTVTATANDGSGVFGELEITISGQTGGGGGGGGGGSVGGGTSAPTTIPSGDGSVSVTITQAGSVATLALPDAKVSEIIDKAKDGKASFNLSKVSGATGATLPKAALTQLAGAGLAVEIALPQGTAVLDASAARSVAAQANGASITMSVSVVGTTSLSAVQQAALKPGDLVYNLSLMSGTQVISSYNGLITVTVPYSGDAPVAVWYLDGTGEMEKLTGVYDATAKTFTFTTSHLSLFVVGPDDGITQIKLIIGKLPYTINGVAKEMDAAPEIVNDRTMVPLRFVAEALDAEVNWNADTRTVTVELDGKTLSVVIGELAPGMDTPAMISGDRTMVPLRYISETLGCDVLWNAGARSVRINK